MNALLQHVDSLGPAVGYLVLFVAGLAVFFCMTFFTDFDGGSDGASDSGDGTGDPSGSGTDGAVGLFQYLTFRNAVNYTIGFGAAGYLATLTHAPQILVAILALSGGGISAFIMYKLMYLLFRLENVQNLNPRDAIGELGRVSMVIGADRTHRGKILVTLNSAQRELYAVTDGSAIGVGEAVRVLAVEGDVYLVESE